MIGFYLQPSPELRRGLILSSAFLLFAAGVQAQGSSSKENPTVSFATPGVKTITLQACNSAGCGTVTKMVTVLDPVPQIVSTVVPTLVGTGQAVTLQDTSTGRPPLTHQWTLTDILNNSTTVSGDPATWTAPATPGVYLAQLQVMNTDGSATSLPVPVTVVASIFADVPPDYFAWKFVQNVYNRGIFDPCSTSPLDFCPNGNITREEMAILLLRAKEGATYMPPPCVTPQFADVPCSDPAAAWVNELVVRGVTAGCGGGNYCPNNPVTRDQMAVFLLVTVEGSTYRPDQTCFTAPFDDVPCYSPYAIWIRELVARGVTAGCGGGAYCPTNVVNRGQMSVFISTAFNLPPP
jgi:hypothetical protein